METVLHFFVCLKDSFQCGVLNSIQPTFTYADCWNQNFDDVLVPVLSNSAKVVLITCSVAT